MSDLISQLAIAILGVFAIGLVANKSKWGFVAGLASQPFWYITSYQHAQWGIFFLNIAYTFSWSYGIYVWFFRDRYNSSMKNSALTDYPRVGVGVMVMKGDKVLMGLRKGSHGAGQYAWPGGHLEYMESFTHCAQREVREETGVEIENVRFLRLLNLKDYAPKHYVDIALIADWKSGEPQVLEPHKCAGWDWYDIDELPQPLFSTIVTYIEAYRTGKTFFDA